MSDDVQDQDCAVCLQKCHHPTKLPCGHIFCFLCVKGIAIQSRKCAMCRSEIPRDYLDHPLLLDNQHENLAELHMENQWYYEGRNGWWKYDERSNIELERAFNNGENHCSLLLAGTLYNIDFQTMMQVRRSDQARRRRVRRDSPLFPAKGVAGIKTEEINIESTKMNEDVNSNSNTTQEDIIEIPDDEEDTEVNEPITIEIEVVSDELDRIL